jgi:plastocyanin
MATAVIVFPAMAPVCRSAELEWGNLRGRVVIEGEVPKLKPLVEKGAVNVKDPACCAAQEIPDHKYVVDEKTSGIANVAIYLRQRPAKVHPELETTSFEPAGEGDKEKNKQDEIKLEQKACQFEPHVVFVQTGQRIRVINRDSVAHNFHTFPIRNQPCNMITQPMDPNGVLSPPIKSAEKSPFKISCDIHPWMSAYCIALDHPYCAVTDKTGRFEMPKLPVGSHHFIVWHETMGIIEKNYTVKIEKELNLLQPLTVEIH